MTMQFEAATNVDLAGLSEGDAISFDFNPETDDGYVISAIRPANQTEIKPGSAAGINTGHDDH